MTRAKKTGAAPTGAPVTLRQIAEAAGTSQSVVSAVLAGRTGHVRYSEETAARVQREAERLRYRPNRSAQGLRASRHNAVAILTSALYLLPEMYLHWLTIALAGRNQLLVLQHLPADAQDATCTMLAQRCVDALVCAEVPGAAFRRHIAEAGLPVLFVNAEPPMRAPRLLFDEEGAMRMATGHFRDNGYDRVALCCNADRHHYWGTDRRRGIRESAAQHGMPDPAIVDAAGPVPGTLDLDGATDQVMRALRPGTGLILEYREMIPLLLRRLDTAGLRIPQDVGILIFGRRPTEYAEWSNIEVETRLLAEATVGILADPLRMSRDGTIDRFAYLLTAGASTRRTTGLS